MNVRVIARSFAGWLALMTAIAACTIVPAARPSQAVPTTVATPTTVTTPTRPAVTLRPSAATNTPTVAATAPTTPSSTPTEVPPSPSSRPGGEGDPPPEGLLLAGGPEVAGRPGTYCYGGTCVDMARWPPKADLPELAGSADVFQFSLEGDVPFMTWSASYARTSGDQSTHLDSGGDPYDPDASGSPPPQFVSASFPSPPAGDWVVFMAVVLEHGDLSYAWHVTVP